MDTPPLHSLGLTVKDQEQADRLRLTDKRREERSLCKAEYYMDITLFFVVFRTLHTVSTAANIGPHARTFSYSYTKPLLLFFGVPPVHEEVCVPEISIINTPEIAI